VVEVEKMQVMGEKLVSKKESQMGEFVEEVL